MAECYVITLNTLFCACVWGVVILKVWKRTEELKIGILVLLKRILLHVKPEQNHAPNSPQNIWIVKVQVFTSRYGPYICWPNLSLSSSAKDGCVVQPTGGDQGRPQRKMWKPQYKSRYQIFSSSGWADDAVWVGIAAANTVIAQFQG